MIILDIQVFFLLNVLIDDALHKRLTLLRLNYQSLLTIGAILEKQRNIAGVNVGETGVVPALISSQLLECIVPGHLSNIGHAITVRFNSKDRAYKILKKLLLLLLLQDGSTFSR